MDNNIKSKILSAIPKGKNNAMTAKNLSIKLGLPTNDTNFTLRKIIKVMVEEDGELIGSTTANPKGFFLINSKDELGSYLDSLEKRIEKTINRRNSLIDNWNNNNKVDRSKLWLAD